MLKRLLNRKLIMRITCYSLGGLVLAALVTQFFLIRELYSRTDRHETQVIKDVLTDSIRSLNIELAVDPVTGRHTIPAARITFPAQLETHIYHRDMGYDNAPIWFVSASNQLQAIDQMRTAWTLEGTFKEVEKVQMCSRQVVVSFEAAIPNDSDDKLELKNTKKLKDGRTAHIYENKCPYGSEPILRVVNQLESF